MMPVLYACSMNRAGEHVVQRTALDDYIHQPDPSWTWTLEGEIWQTVADVPNAKVKRYQVSMVSQTWTAAIKYGVSPPAWHHRLVIYRPETVRSDKAFLFIDGGTRYPSNPEEGDITHDIFNQVDFARIAAKTGAVVVDLKDVPNQYLRFSDGKPRKEDDLIAWTWYHFLHEPDDNESLLLQFPMVKSAVRAMDTVQAVLSYKGVNVERFVLAGASKRGWTAWLTAAVDERTDSLIPVVIDILKGEAFIDHVYKAHQGPIPALSDYYASEHNVIAYAHTPEMQRLLMLVDPYRYRDRLKMPKYIVTASGDDFFPPDSARLYLDELLGPTWMRTFPNSRHYVFRDPGGLARATDTFEAFLGVRVENRFLPDVAWRLSAPGRLSATMDRCPKRATLWQVTNPYARDFRMTALATNGLQYNPAAVTLLHGETCQFSIDIDTPKTGWTAWFVELAFDNAPYPDIVLTSKVSVIPDLYPDSCYTSGNQSDACFTNG
ncbi:MAG: hypothetical protein B0D91_11595 [Oceanospirillales bacterium LUC14_002_19_P2]|nr:MAG: hypothetical protein B0D91_11595 [Oceanospirillales bacterium LUC14_002_19_P2]